MTYLVVPAYPAILSAFDLSNETVDQIHLSHILESLKPGEGPYSVLVWERGVRPTQSYQIEESAIRKAFETAPRFKQLPSLKNEEVKLLGEILGVLPRDLPDHFTFLNTAWWNWGQRKYESQDLGQIDFVFYNVIRTNRPKVWWHEGGFESYWGCM